MNIIKQQLDNNELNRLVIKICRDITLSDWKPDYVVGITRGGLIPALMISHWFDIRMETLKVNLRDGTSQCESNLWMAEDAFGYDPDIPTPKILVVDDINDSGETFNWIMKDWRTSCLPNDPRWNSVWNQNVRFAVLYDNVASNCEVKMDYSGQEINKQEKNVWIDFPWESWWR